MSPKPSLPAEPTPSTGIARLELLTRVMLVVMAILLGLTWVQTASAAELTVGFDDSASKHQMDSEITAADQAVGGDATQTDAIPQIKSRVITVPDAKVAKITERLLRSGRVKFVEPNHTRQRRWTPTDSLFYDQWNLKKINMPAAWDTQRGDPNVIVAVIDSGVDVTHPDLAGRLVPGWNFLDNNANVRDDSYAHGTFVTGVLAANAGSGPGIAGVAPLTRVMPLKVFHGDKVATDSVLAKSILYAADHGAKVINLSWGGPEPAPILQEALNTVVAKGVLPVCAVDNVPRGTLTYPDKYASCFAVGASNSSDTKTSWSNYGTGLDLLAPGTSIWGTVPGALFAKGEGTSFATPTVAGVAALLIANGTTGVSAVRNALTGGARDLGPVGYDTTNGYGRLDALGSLYLSNRVAPPQRYRTIVCTNGLNRAFNPFASTGFAAYTEGCPSSTRGGLITRNAVGTSTSTVTNGAGATQVVNAPAGLIIAGVWWAGRITATDCGWTVGLGGTGITWLRGRKGGPTTSCPYTPSNPYKYSSLGEYIPVGGSTFYQIAQCAMTTCKTSSTGVGPYYTRAEVDTFGAEVELQDTVKPTITITGGITGNVNSSLAPTDTRSGVITITWNSTDASGIAGLNSNIDGSAPTPLPRPCDYSYLKPCSDVLGSSITLDTRTLTNGTHHVAISAKDAGGNVQSTIYWFSVAN